MLYKFVDTYEYDNSDLTFLIESNISAEKMEDIEAVSSFIWREEERQEVPKELLSLYDKYFEDLCGTSKVEIIQMIVEGEGYTWQEPEIIEIEW